MSPEDCVSDVEFILSECKRFQQDMNRLGVSRWLKTLSPLDSISFLPHPSGKGSMICGAAALGRFRHLAIMAIRNSDAAGTLSPGRVESVLRKVIVRHFLHDKYSVSLHQVRSVFVAAVEKAKSTRSDETHFIPCHLASTAAPEQFNIGPVIFRPQHSFGETIRPHLEELEAERRRAGFTTNRRTLIEDYYGAFGWVAQVRVLNCDNEISEERARRAVNAAIDVLQVVLGPAHTKKMASGGHARAHDKRAHLSLGRGSKASASYQWRAITPVALDNLQEILTDKDLALQLENGGRAIEPIVDPSLDWPISRRFIEASSWYGEAVREEFEAARIIKAVTALERLLITNRKDKKKVTVSERGAALVVHCHNSFGFAEWRERLSLAYRLRSELVHGSLSPFDPEVRQRSSWCVELSSDVLNSALFGFGASEGIDLNVTDAKLSKWFNQLVEKSRDLSPPI